LKKRSSHAVADLDLDTSTLCSAIANVVCASALPFGATANFYMKAVLLKRLAQASNGS